jgi:hypothetical protein
VLHPHPRDTVRITLMKNNLWRVDNLISDGFIFPYIIPFHEHVIIIVRKSDRHVRARRYIAREHGR